MRGRQSGSGQSYNIDTPFSYVYLLAAALVFWVVGYIESVGYPVYEGVSSTPLWNAVCRLLTDKTVTYLIGFLLAAGGAFLIHRANYVLAIIREKTLMPFVLYFLLISTNPDYIPLRSTSVGIFCLIIAMYQLFLSYHNRGATDRAFNTALFIGLGSLLWVHILWFVPLFWYGMYRLQSMNTRTFLASLMGLCTVYWFLLGWCLFQWDFTPFTVPFLTLTKIDYMLISGAQTMDWAIIIYLVALSVISSIFIMTHVNDENIRTRQYLYFLMLFAILSFALFFLYEQSSGEFLGVACMPISILLTHLFTVKRGRKRFWAFHLTAIVYILLSFIRLWNPSLNMGI